MCSIYKENHGCMQQARGSRWRLIQTGETAEAKFTEVGRRREQFVNSMVAWRWRRRREPNPTSTRTENIGRPLPPLLLLPLLHLPTTNNGAPLHQSHVSLLVFVYSRRDAHFETQTPKALLVIYVLYICLPYRLKKGNKCAAWPRLLGLITIP